MSRLKYGTLEPTRWTIRSTTTVFFLTSSIRTRTAHSISLQTIIVSLTGQTILRLIGSIGSFHWIRHPENRDISQLSRTFRQMSPVICFWIPQSSKTKDCGEWFWLRGIWETPGVPCIQRTCSRQCLRPARFSESPQKDKTPRQIGLHLTLVPLPREQERMLL